MKRALIMFFGLGLSEVYAGDITLTVNAVATAVGVNPHLVVIENRHDGILALFTSVSTSPTALFLLGGVLLGLIGLSRMRH